MALGLAILGLPKAVAAGEKFHVVTLDWPPLSFIGNARQLAGLGIERLRAAAQASDADLEIEMLSSSVALARAEREALIILPLTRTPEREAKFHWLARLAADQYCFVTLARAASIDSLEQARGLNLIGVHFKGATRDYLERQGFSRLDPSPPLASQPRKLAARRIDAWFATTLTYPGIVRAAGLDPNDFKCGARIEAKDLWVAANKTIDASRLASLSTQLRAWPEIKAEP